MNERELEALAKVAHDAWCSADDWDELDAEARGDWVNVARDVLAAANASTPVPHVSEAAES